MSGAGSKKVAVVAGDGIGPEVIESALAVLDAVGAQFEPVPVEIGLARWKRTGLAMAEEDLEALKECDCILFGAISTPPDPNYKSVLLRIRKELDLYANIRPFPVPGSGFHHRAGEHGGALLGSGGGGGGGVAHLAGDNEGRLGEDCREGLRPGDAPGES